MSRTIGLISAIGFVVLGGAMGGLVSEWRRPPAHLVSALAKEATCSLELDDLGQRLATVERTVLELQYARTLTERLKANADASLARRASSVPVGSIDDPVFDEAVRDALERIETTRDSEHQAEIRQNAAQQWSDYISQELALSDVQKSKVMDLAMEFAQTSLAMESEGNEEPLDYEARRVRRNLLRDQYEGRLADVLDGKQMASYRSLDEKTRRGPEFDW